MSPRRALLVAPRRIGDVLLVTPLLASLHAAWPQARIDALVFAGTGGVLEGQPGLGEILAIDERPALRDHLRLLARIAGRYDVALSAVPSDRSTLYARIAARQAAGVVAPGLQQRWKRVLLGHAVPFDDLDTHSVVQSLRLADALGIGRVARVHVASAPLPAPVEAELGRDPFAVIHPSPRFRYKLWSPDAQVDFAHWLQAAGLRPVLTGSADAREREQADWLAQRMPANTLNLCGRLTLEQLGRLLGLARLYAGPDTVATHLAAAAGVPTIALFGPSNPVKWGPWPVDWTDDASPWSRVGSARQGNVWLIQGEADCAPGVPCLAEGCDRHIDSGSRCLESLPASRAIDAARELLGLPASD